MPSRCCLTLLAEPVTTLPGINATQPDVTPESFDYMDGIEGEAANRLAVLSLVYSKPRTCPDEPRISSADLEKRVNLPREYLDFATWYLRSKKYTSKEDNSDFSLTALGVDYVESNAAKILVLHKMLNDGGRGKRNAGVQRGEARSQVASEVLRLVPVDQAAGASPQPTERTDGKSANVTRWMSLHAHK